MLILGFIFAIVLLCSASINKTYFHLPLRELKRRARNGDALAKQLYKPVAYGMDLRLLLGIVSIVSAAISILLITSNLANWLAFFIIALLLSAAFMWLPNSRQSSLGDTVAKFLAPVVAKALHFLHTPLSFLSEFVSKHFPYNMHTGLYSKEDIIELLDMQKDLEDNQVAESEITIAKNALVLSQKTIRNILMPAKEVRLVSAAEPISPILIDELHKTGHTVFPVYEGKKSNIVGILELSDLVAAARRTSPVSSIMRRSVNYVHEDFTLPEFVHAIKTARQHLFVVINSFEEFIGVVTAADLLNQLLIPEPVGFPDDYESPAAVTESIIRKEEAAARRADIELTEENLVGEPVEVEEPIPTELEEDPKETDIPQI